MEWEWRILGPLLLLLLVTPKRWLDTNLRLHSNPRGTIPAALTTRRTAEDWEVDVCDSLNYVFISRNISYSFRGPNNLEDIMLLLAPWLLLNSWQWWWSPLYTVHDGELYVHRRRLIYGSVNRRILVVFVADKLTRTRRKSQTINRKWHVLEGAHIWAEIDYIASYIP